ncbi:MAG: tetratricopeptide repeat protein [Candidatus Brocadia sinica]|nr:tetratricopeptide repeat protein [Candidatus Brocadia sinica]NUO04861.1 tetratricopeptide repeat protein [Candidatus Brocadia sinica]
MPAPSAQKYFNEAQTSQESGLIEKAVESYKKAIETDPYFISAYYALALLYHQIKQFDNAITNLKKVIELDPNDASAFNNLGVICFANDMFNEAKTYFEKALLIETNYKEARDNLKKIQQKLQQKIQVQPFIEQSINTIRKNKKNLKIGFVSIWFERGQAYVTKTLRDVIAQEHETFVFARTGGVYGRPMLQTDGIWAVPNLTIFNDYSIPHEVIGKWIDDNAIDAVIFNEEYDWSLVDFCKKKGTKVITYLDYYKDDWKPYMYLYDTVLCSTKRTFNLVKDFCNAYYVGWGIDTELFKPLNNDEEKYTFFHNAGWLGINYRKMTPAVILAFDAISRHNPDVTLFIHAQAEPEKLPPQIVNIVHNNTRITYHVETVPAPGLYHKGSILVFPSKLEGLGLPLLEGMACGLPAIATDAPPMNEFVQDDYNGLLVKVAQRLTRQDNIAFPEEIVDMNDLVFKMDYLIKNPELVYKMQNNARNSVNNYNTFSKKVYEVINNVQ